jgi:hypothetical protein
MGGRDGNTRVPRPTGAIGGTRAGTQRKTSPKAAFATPAARISPASQDLPLDPGSALQPRCRLSGAPRVILRLDRRIHRAADALSLAASCRLVPVDPPVKPGDDGASAEGFCP